MQKNQDRSNMFKTKLKSTKATCLAPQTHQNHIKKKHSGFITFLENQLFAKLVPFPAIPNCSRNPIFRRRSKPIKTKLKSTQVTKPLAKCQYFLWNFNDVASWNFKMSIFPTEFQWFCFTGSAQPSPAQPAQPCLWAARVSHFLHWSNAFLMKI